MKLNFFLNFCCHDTKKYFESTTSTISVLTNFKTDSDFVSSKKVQLMILFRISYNVGLQLTHIARTFSLKRQKDKNDVDWKCRFTLARLLADNSLLRFLPHLGRGILTIRGGQ